MVKKSLKSCDNQFRNGAVSIIAVMFATMAMSLIALSFVGQMRSGLAQNVAYTTSMAAYDAALSGIHDTHIAINQCLRFPNGNAEFNFTRGHCAVILNNNNHTCEQTKEAIAHVVGITRITNAGVVQIDPGAVDREANQEYSCVSITPRRNVFTGQLNSRDSVATVPLAAINPGNGQPAQVARVGVYWYRSSAAVAFPDPSTARNPSSGTNSWTYGHNIGQTNRITGLAGSRYLRPTRVTGEPPIIGVEISQLPTTFSIANLISDNDGLTTNHGYMMLAPTVGRDHHRYYNAQSGGVNMNFVGSADHALHSPNAARCNNTNYLTNASGEPFRCGAFIHLPRPRGDVNRDNDHSFIRLSLPHLESEPADFEVRFYDSANNPLYFAATQFDVSVQGRAGGRVRRLNAFIGGVRGTQNDILPDFSAVIHGSANLTKCIDSQGNVMTECQTGTNTSIFEATYESGFRQWEDRVSCSWRYFGAPVLAPSGTRSCNFPELSPNADRPWPWW